MEKRTQAAAIITAALLRDYPKPSLEKITELLAQALEAVDVAISLETRRQTKKNAELRMNTVSRRT